MAGTLLPAPTLGASDWSAWIALVDACRRGYLVASYTNFAASAESAVAAGSLVEVAGAIYSFTETAIDYTGAGSTNSDLYIFVKPDAVVSTATVVAWGSAPVWVDAKQGFYASAASTTRCIGGMYVASAATYMHKYIYTEEIARGCIQRNSTRPILFYYQPLGEWNMDATASIGFTLKIWDTKILSVDAVIRGDTSAFVNVPITYSVTGSAVAGYIFWSDYSFTVGRFAGGSFDNTDYDGTVSTVANRGYLYIEYEA